MWVAWEGPVALCGFFLPIYQHPSGIPLFYHFPTSTSFSFFPLIYSPTSTSSFSLTSPPSSTSSTPLHPPPLSIRSYIPPTPTIASELFHMVSLNFLRTTTFLTITPFPSHLRCLISPPFLMLMNFWTRVQNCPSQCSDLYHNLCQLRGIWNFSIASLLVWFVFLTQLTQRVRS